MPRIRARRQARPRVSLFGGRARPPPRPPSGAPAPPPPRRTRRSGLSSLSGLLSFVLLGALTGFALLAWAMIEARKPGPLAADKIVVIAREDDGGPIGDQLEREGVIDSAIWFSAMTLLDGSRGELKRGEYAFKAGVSLRQVEAELIAHKVVQHKLSVPEGLTSDQIVAAPAGRRRARRRHQGAPARGLAASGHLFLRARRHAPGHGDANGQSAGQDSRRNLEKAGWRSADQVAGRTGDAGFDRREGDGQGRRAPASRRRLRQSAAEAHEAAIGPDDRLRAGIRQGHARALHHQGRARSGDALQYVQYRRPAAGTDLQSRQSGARGGRESVAHQGALFRR